MESAGLERIADAIENISRNNWSWVVGVISSITAVVSVWVAFRAAKTSQETQMDLLRPVIAPISEGWVHNGNHIKFKIKNIGQGPLTNLACPQRSLGAAPNSSSLAPSQDTEVWMAGSAEDALAKAGSILFRYQDTYGRTCETTIKLAVSRQGPDHTTSYDFGLPERWPSKSIVVKNTLN
ncbi:MAG: hypothetical protein HZB70_03655 [Candidatus Berkelbacteria bacterium]|nr:MAG: hypothetical protein HZB70_03655 [Candidatus Berkelbacteria bacterium]QQG51604.1 MAG: hypothetical protein HY845_03535 [Candidatus Berkelbacteria bacterium]